MMMMMIIPIHVRRLKNWSSNPHADIIPRFKVVKASLCLCRAITETHFVSWMNLVLLCIVSFWLQVGKPIRWLNTTWGLSDVDLQKRITGNFLSFAKLFLVLFSHWFVHLRMKQMWCIIAVHLDGV
jgi:hypothetical protein